MEILKVEGLCKRYPSFCLQNVSFSMQPGTIMGFIGRNGAGKTTTLKSLLHLVHPDSGTISMFGLDMDTHEREIREKEAADAHRRHAEILSRLERRALPRASVALRARRTQARVRAVRGHEGQVSAGGGDVARRAAADSG